MKNEKRIENTSKKNQRIARETAQYYFDHKNRLYSDIFSAYKKPSSKKIIAWNYCKELCKSMHGFDLYISAAGCQTFSVIFKFYDSKKRLCFAYITRDYNRFCYAE